MGVVIKKMFSVYNRDSAYDNTVTSLAQQALSPILSNGTSHHFTHLVTSTTCPDSLAPSFGQLLNEHFHPVFSQSHVYDLVQGCAGGVSALILGAQLAETHRGNVAVVLADAARQAVSEKNEMRKIFGNGAFACIMQHEDSDKGLIHYKSYQYKDLSEVVTVKLGHQAHREIVEKKEHVINAPLDTLGLTMNPFLAVRLLRHAETFYKEFLSECPQTPDYMIFHQVNPEIMKTLRSRFATAKTRFIDLSGLIGNCGSPSFGIAMEHNKEQLSGKKVFTCSFGTGGVITAALWQF